MPDLVVHAPEPAVRLMEAAWARVPVLLVSFAGLGYFATYRFGG